MQSKEQFCNLISRTISRAATVALAIAIVFALTVVLTQSGQAQTFKVIHNFTGGGDGTNPYAGLTLDQAGNLYGTTCGIWCSGEGGSGNVFRLSKKGSTWVLTPLYTFGAGNDGAAPFAGVILGPDGSLYGTTYAGGGDGCFGPGCGTVFSLKPYPTACKTAICGWQETVLYRFTGGSDGGQPALADLIFDQAGNLYGTTRSGGPYGEGTVYELVPSQGGWTEKVLYSFTGGSDGGDPYAGLVFDNVGNLYGTTITGGTSSGNGVVFELAPSGSGWTVNVLYTFQGGNDGRTPYGGLIFDPSGNLYGATSYGGEGGGGGTVFELTPSGGSWTFSLLYSFTGDEGPAANLVMDGAGSLYGTTIEDGANGAGNVFKLTPSGGSWTYTSLYDFTGGSDGWFPACNVVFGASGNLYGTAYGGGAYGYGVVWEITP